MVKLVKYLKPFWLSVLCVVGLLFVQAQTELALPSYMSDIVTYGIQYGGIDSSALTAVRESEAENLMLFMSDEEIETFHQAYTFIEQGNTEYIEKYPALANENIYVLTNYDEQLETMFQKPLTVVSVLSSGKLADLIPLPEDGSPSSIFDVIRNNPEMKQGLLEMIDEQLTAMGGSSSYAAGANLMAKAEYEALGMDVGQIQTNYILREGGMMLLIALGGALCAVLVGFLSSRIAAGLSYNLRSAVFKKVEQFSSYEFNKFSTASLITRTTNDVQQVQMAIVMTLRIVVYAPIMGIGALINVFNTNVSMVWIICLVLVIILSLILTTMMVAMPKFKIAQKLVDRLNLVLREKLEGLPVIRAFNTQQHEQERFDRANTDITRVNLFINRTMSILMPMMMLVMNGVSILIIWVGANYIDLGTLQIGEMMAFMQYTMQILMSFMMISMVSIMLPRAGVAANRICEVIDTPLSIADPAAALAFDESQKGRVVFNHVSFKYPGAEENILEDIDFVAEPGQTTAFIGSTGSGKSTLINLIPRFFDVSEGELLVDGVNVRQVRQHDLREKIGYIPQKGMLFSGDIESNIKYGNENATPQEVLEAIEIAQAKEFVESKPDQVHTPIAQGGTNVSGGQKQRLSIARAIVRKPEILIFDDSFSALDFKTDAALRAALEEMNKKIHSTILIVAQRINTIMNADQIIVLDKGKIVGKGTHRDLMQTCPVYQEIAASQLTKEELENV